MLVVVDVAAVVAVAVDSAIEAVVAVAVVEAVEVRQYIRYLDMDWLLN